MSCLQNWEEMLPWVWEMLVIWSTDGTVWDSGRVNYHVQGIFSHLSIQKPEGDGQRFLKEALAAWTEAGRWGETRWGAGAALTWQVCAPDSGPATPSSSRERGRTAGVSAAGPGEEPRPPTPGASRVSHHHMGMIWGSGLQGSGGRSRLRFP